MKLKSIIISLAAACLLPVTTQAQNVIWDYTALGAAPATNDKLFLYDTSATASKTLTIADLFTSPSLTTPALGVATGTSFNGLTITSSTGTLTITNGKTFAVTHGLTLAGTDSTTMTFPSASGTVITSSLSSNAVDAANAIWGASNALVLEGATADTSEISLTPADATADVVYLLPDAAAASYSLMSSALATNAVDIANSVTGASNALVFEGATADAHEAKITPADVTADVVYLLPDAAAASYSIMSSTLTTNGVDIANSVTGTSGGLFFEGSTADSSEIKLVAADATADAIYTLPAAAAATYSLMSSTLATNAPDIANSVTGASAALVFEGTADAHETSLTATDATADRTATLPNATGTVHLAQASTTTALTADDQAVTPGSNTVLQLTSDAASATDRTFTLSATGAITGQIYVIIGPATNACELGDTSIQKLSNTWTPSDTDSLSLLFDGTNFIEIARSNN